MIKAKLIDLDKGYEAYDGESQISLSDEVYDFIISENKATHASNQKILYHKANYSLDACDCIERKALARPLQPDEICELKETYINLYAALDTLPESQRRRVWAHHGEGINKAELARMENVDESAIRRSIEKAIKALRKFYENN